MTKPSSYWTEDDGSHPESDQEDRDPVVWQQVEGTVKLMTAMENCPGFKGREVSMGEKLPEHPAGLGTGRN